MSKLLEHAPDMARYRRVARWAEVVHFQWFAVGWLNRFLLPRRPIVVTAHDLLPREPRPGQVGAQRRLYEAVDAVVTHSEFGRDQLVDRVGVPADKVSVIHHGAFDHLAALPRGPLPPELAHGTDDPDAPVVLFFGLLRPYKGLDVLLAAWRAMSSEPPLGPAPRLWIVGRPRMALEPLRSAAPPGVEFVPRFVSEAELAACFDRASLVVLPYTSTSGLISPVSWPRRWPSASPRCSATWAASRSWRPPARRGSCRPATPIALAEALSQLLGDADERERWPSPPGRRRGAYSWTEAARRTLALYDTVT